MASILPFNGLACSSSPLGIAASPLSLLAQGRTSEAISQLCDRPTDSMYQFNPDSTTISYSSDLIDVTITMPANDVISDPFACYSAFSSVATQCFGSEQVWGGEFYDGDFVYAIAKAASADSIVETLENSAYGQESGIFASVPASTVIEASGVPSGFPVPSGVASGFPGDGFPFPTPTATITASGFPGDWYPFPTPTATVAASGYYTGPIASGFEPPFPSEVVTASSVFIPSGVESGYFAAPTPEAPVFPGWSEDSFAKVRRGSGQREEVEADVRPKARWIMG